MCLHRQNPEGRKTGVYVCVCVCVSLHRRSINVISESRHDIGTVQKLLSVTRASASKWLLNICYGFSVSVFVSLSLLQCT